MNRETLNQSNPGRAGWTTFDEIAFIGHLMETHHRPTRIQLMEGYLAGFSRRVVWGPINRVAVQDALFAAMRDL